MRIDYLLGESLRSIQRNRAAFVLATGVQGVCLTLLTISLVATFNVHSLIRSVGRTIEVHAFLADDADTSALLPRFRLLEGITDARYVSKDEALSELRRELGDDAGLIDALEDNPLPASVRATLERGFAATERLADVERKMGLLPGVVEVWSGRESLARLDRILRTAVLLGIAILVIVALSITFIAFQTAETAILTRRHEIAIMQLVGASRRDVRAPFLLETAAQGILGGVAAFLMTVLLVAACRYVLPDPVFPVWLALGFSTVVGAVLGLLGATIALDRIQA